MLSNTKAFFIKNQLDVKIIGIVTVVVIVLSILMGLYTIAAERKLIVKQFDAKGQLIAASIAPAVIEGLLILDYPFLETITESVVNNAEHIIYVRIKRHDGLTVAHSSSAKTVLTDNNILYFNKPIKVGKEPDNSIGEIEIALHTDDMYATIKKRVQKNAVAFLIYSLVLGLTLTALIKRIIVDRVVSLRNQAELLGNGLFGREIVGDGDDAIGELAHSLETMRKNINTAYASIKVQNDNLNTILQASHEGIVVTDQHSTIVLVNHSAERLLGKTKQEIINTGYDNLFACSDNTEKFLFSHSNQNQPVIIQHNHFILSINSATIGQDNGDKIGSATLIRNITKEKENEQNLKRIAVFDALTGLYNRGFLDKKLIQLFNVSRKRLTPLGLILFDIDYFKPVNDNYGHDRGDKVLRELSDRIKGCIRPSDIPCRYGGEEFCVVLPSARLDYAHKAAERIRLAVSEKPLAGLNITVSLGVVSFPEVFVYRHENLLIEADKALYKAKKAGRNRSVLAELKERA